MGAGLSQFQLKNRIRYRLQKLAREHGGTYSRFIATGEKNGLQWRAGIGVLRASNGETFGQDHVTITGPSGVRNYRLDLEQALYAYTIDASESPPEGAPGAFNALFAFPGFFQTWGRRGCFSCDSWLSGMSPAASWQGFTLFDIVNKRELAIKGEEADKVAPLFYKAVRPNVRIELRRNFKDSEDLKAEYDRAAARADAIDALIDSYADDPRWQASTDWRASPDYAFGTPGSKPFGLKAFAEVGAGKW